MLGFGATGLPLIGCAIEAPLAPAIVTPAWTAVATAGLVVTCGLP